MIFTHLAWRSPLLFLERTSSIDGKDKISKGDIAGMFLKQGNLSNEQLGVIELKQDCAFVAVPVSMANELVENLNNTKLKKKKVRVFIV